MYLSDLHFLWNDLLKFAPANQNIDFICTVTDGRVVNLPMWSLNNFQGKIFGVWLRVLRMRNLILEKKIEVQKFQHEIKLCQIVNPQIRLLNDWAKLEGKNIEAVGRVTRKLSALCVKIPCDDDVQVRITFLPLHNLSLNYTQWQNLWFLHEMRRIPYHLLIIVIYSKKAYSIKEKQQLEEAVI